MGRIIVCVQCPLSCRLEVTPQAGKAVVAGNKCPRGLSYAEKEVINPSRTLTTTVRTCFSDFPLLSVRTEGEIPLASIFAVMQEINCFLVQKRLRPGDVVIPRLAGTDSALIATDDMTAWRQPGEQAAACH